MPTPLDDLSYAKKYFNDAPAECWEAPEVLHRIKDGKWGMSHTNGGLLGFTYNNYHFRYRGQPLWGLPNDGKMFLY